MLQSWLLLPVLLATLSLGTGLLIERAAGRRLPGELLLPLGLAGTMVAARAVTVADATAVAATPLVVLLAVGGLVLRRRDRRAGELERWTAAAAVAVFAIFAAPVVLTGTASFAGYTVLGDTAVQLLLTDVLLTRGGDLDGLGISTFSETARGYLTAGYPLGPHAALGAVRPLTGTDVAWLYQPLLAFVAAMLALTIASLLRPAIDSAWRRAAIAAVAAQPALVYSFALQGSVKELVTLWLVPLLAALLTGLTRAEGAVRVRELVPLAIASAASVAAIGVAAAAWLGPVLLVALVLVVRRADLRPRRAAALAAAFIGMLAALAVPSIAVVKGYAEVQDDILTSQVEFGNLLGPLRSIQVFGVWLQGDYRLALDVAGSTALVTHGLIAFMAAAAVMGFAWLVGRRAIAPIVYAIASLIALVYVVRIGSPWADAKALTIASPAALVLAGAGVEALRARGLGGPAAVIAVVLAGGVLVSNGISYSNASIAPRDRLEELSELGERLEGRGPVLYTEFEEFGKYFLRDARPVGATEAQAIPGLTPLTRDGERPPFASTPDLDDLALAEVQRFPAIVLRRSPVASRPPAGYRRTWSGRFYEIWERGARRALAHLPLGDEEDGGTAPAPCREVGILARRARAAGGQLAAARAPALGSFSPRALPDPLPAGWSRPEDKPLLLRTAGAGVARGSLTVPASGGYEVWLLGSIGREVSVRLDGRDLAAVKRQLSQPAGWVSLGTVDAEGGPAPVELSRGARTLAPGSGDTPQRTLGPLAITPAGARARVERVPVDRWRSLCGRQLDWVEVLRR